MDDYRKALVESLDKKIEDTTLLLSDPELKEMAELELAELNKQKNQIMGNFGQAQSDEEDSLDERNTILQISGAAGGEEAKLWAEELLRMYKRFTERVGIKVEQ